MPKVTMYCTPWCPYCVRARMLLKQKGVDFDEMRIDTDPSLRREMESRANATSVPQIFIDQEHVGGCDELYALERDGKLDPLLGLA
jgi:glutaredoxin 3